jgi:hypothetical protein
VFFPYKDKIIFLYVVHVFLTIQDKTKDGEWNGNKDSSYLIFAVFLQECNFDLFAFPNISTSSKVIYGMSAYHAMCYRGEMY